MRVLVGCEFTGIVRDAFIRQGHDAISCDIIKSESAFGPHHQGDIIAFLKRGKYYDLGIFHPDCTYMAVCGNRHYAGTALREQAIKWTLEFWDIAKEYCGKVNFENPVSVLWPYLRKVGATVQYVQPYQFGHPETKNTGLGLHNLPKLKETDNVYDYMMTLPKKDRHRIWYASPSDDRGMIRSRTYPGIAEAMASQWG